MKKVLFISLLLFCTVGLSAAEAASALTLDTAIVAAIENLDTDGLAKAVKERGEIAGKELDRYIALAEKKWQEPFVKQARWFALFAYSIFGGFITSFFVGGAIGSGLGLKAIGAELPPDVAKAWISYAIRGKEMSPEQKKLYQEYTARGEKLIPTIGVWTGFAVGGAVMFPLIRYLYKKWQEYKIKFREADQNLKLLRGLKK